MGRKERGKAVRIERLNSNTMKNLQENLLKRSPGQYQDYEQKVLEILEKVREKGDEAVFSYTEQFDKVKLNSGNVLVKEEEIFRAYEDISKELLMVMRRALVNIRNFHQKQKQNSWFDTKENGSIVGQRATPLQRVGVYVPGGKASYPSSVLMNVVPAKIAGVAEVIMVTPPNGEGKIDSSVLVAAKEAGVNKIYKVGGAQGIGALAYGTETIPKVDKIIGPGNIYVALAKKAVYGHVSIDSIAGPSEILILADEGANPVYVAADLLSQAEHDELASSILITTCEDLVDKVNQQIEIFLKELSRSEIIKKSLDNYGYILIAKDMEQAIEAANEIASEHLEIMTKNPFEVMTKIRNAGAIFLGDYSPEPIGDYYAGPNHVLPTNGTAKFFSPLAVDDFIKKTSIIAYSKEALLEVSSDVDKFARMEQLTAHANSIKVRNL
jgi:histidinol dehydrogenase